MINAKLVCVCNIISAQHIPAIQYKYYNSIFGRTMALTIQGVYMFKSFD